MGIEIITNQYFDEIGIVKYNRFLVSKLLETKFSESFHGEARKHLRFTKHFPKNASNYYCPGIAKTLKNESKAVKYASRTNDYPMRLSRLNNSINRNGT